MLCEAHDSKQWRAQNREQYIKIRDRTYAKAKLLGKVDKRTTWRAPSTAWQKSARRKLKEKLIRYYSYGTNKCVCKNCGISDMEFLGIDHINGNGAEHRRELKGADLYYWLVKNNYPSGFRVLCHNCNFSHGHYGYCPHEVKSTPTFNYRMKIYKPKR